MDLTFNNAKFGHVCYTTEGEMYDDGTNNNVDDDDRTHASQSTAITADNQHCLICYSDDLTRHRGIVSCGHDDVCASCHIRLRFLHNDRKCPVCKTTNDTIIVDSDLSKEDAAIELAGTDAYLEGIRHKKFEAYEMWGNELGAGYTYREDVGMHFPTNYYNEDILPLFSLGCHMQGCGFTNATDSFVTEDDGDADKPGAEAEGNRRKKEKKERSQTNEWIEGVK